MIQQFGTFAAGFCVCLLLSMLLTGWFKTLSIKNNWFDWPTERSSHMDPVPNIGGLAMSLVIMFVIIILFVSSRYTFDEALLWMAVVGLLSFVGFWDDIKDISTIFRFVVHIIVAIIVVNQFGGINQLDFGLFKIELGHFSYVLGFIWVVGFINMYNFMDGINGLAACQGLICGFVFSVWLLYFGLTGDAFLMIGVAGAATGFLYWNLTPAKVFMGDSGSTMLGGVFAAISLKLHNEVGLSILFPALLFAWFLGDTSYTLLKRTIKGEKIWQAHREHIYQKLAPTPQYHVKVTGMISLLTLIISLMITMVLFKQPYV